MKKLLGIIVFALLIYYFVFSGNDEAEKNKVSTQLETEDRALDYDIKYKDAVKDINEAVDLNLEKIKTTEEMLEGVNSDNEVIEKLESVTSVEERPDSN